MAHDQSNKSIAELRKEYTLAGLEEKDLDPNPMKQFAKWLDEAVEAKLPEPTAMTLATATREGKPSARIVLLKRFDNSGFVFFTNYESRKGKELTENPTAALVFHWIELERQVRIAGSVSRVLREESGAYFHTRPAGSQISAWASRQSEVIPSRSILERNAERFEEEFRGKEIPLPLGWGGFSVKPSEIEFWQGREDRLHDRLRYSFRKNGTWNIERLSP